MRETLEVLEKLEVSREPRIRRQLDRLNARVNLLDRERAGFEQMRWRLKSSRDSMILDSQSRRSVSGFELQSTAARATLIDRQIEQVREDEQSREQQLSLARTRAQQALERLARCVRRQVKLEQAMHRLGKQTTTRQARRDEEQIDQLSSLHWQKERQW